MQLKIRLALTFACLAFLLASTADAATEHNQYDGLGRLISHFNGATATTYTYDANGNILSRTSCTGACFIGGSCHAAGAPDPSMECRSCEPATDSVDWTPSPDGTACATGACQNGTCDGSGAGGAAGASGGGGTAGGAAAAGTAGAAGSAGAGATAGGGTGGKRKSSGEDDGGCGCTTPGRGTPGGTALVALALFGLLAASRRRPARRPQRGRRVSRALPIGIAVVCSWLGAAEAAASTVCKSGNCDYTSIGAALQAASPGETVVVMADTYNESDMGVKAGVSVRSTSPNDPSSVIIDAGGNDRIFNMAAGSSLEGMTLQNGSAQFDGGAVSASGGTYTFRHVAFIGNVANDGGGGAIHTATGSAQVFVSDCVFRNNRAKRGGAISVNSDKVVIDNSLFEDNSTSGVLSVNGGAVSVRIQQLTIRNSTFTGNSTDARGPSGGAIFATASGSAFFDLIDSTVSNNTATGTTSAHGGGISSSIATTIVNSTISGNSTMAGSGTGGGISHTGGALVVLSSQITGNTTVTNGGGIICGGSSKLNAFSGTVSGNSPDQVHSCGSCNAGETQPCTSALPGACAGGMQTCEGTLGVWGECMPTNMAIAEASACTDGVDNDCDGATDAADSDCKPPRTQSEARRGGSSGDPVSTLTGELYFSSAPDLDLGGPLPVQFRRYYASGLLAAGVTGTMGDNWRHNFEIAATETTNTADIVDAMGRTIHFDRVGSTWLLEGPFEVGYQLVDEGSGLAMADPIAERIWHFDNTGLLTAVSDFAGNVLTVTQGADGVAAVSDGLGRTLTFTYAGGRLTSVDDGTRTVQLGYTSSQLTSVTSPELGVTGFSYDASAWLLSVTRPEGNTPWTQTYDGSGRVATQTDAETNVFTFAYAGDTTTIADPLGGLTSHVHVGRSLTSWAQPSGATTTFGYDSQGKRTSVTDPASRVASRTYAGGQLEVSSTDRDGLMVDYTTTTIYAGGLELERIAAVSYPDGTNEQLSWDSRGKLIAITDRDAAVSTFEWNDNGQPLRIVDRAGAELLYTYDAAGRLDTATDLAGNVTTYGYDALGRRATIGRPDGTSRVVVWDDDDRITSITDERGLTATYTWDANDNLITSVDRWGGTTTYDYDDLDRLTSYTDGAGNTASVSYDALGRLASQTDRNGNTTTFAYDADGNSTGYTDPDGQTWPRTQDASGYLTSVSDPLGNTLTMTRDDQGRVTESTSAESRKSTMTYDSMGRVASVTNALGETMTFTYDIRGNVTGVDLGSGVSATYALDDHGQVTTLTDPNGETWTFGYDATGRRISETDPLGNETRIEWDTRNRQSRFILPGSLGDVTITYDAIGNVTRQAYSTGLQLDFTRNEQGLIETGEGLSLGYHTNGWVTDSNGVTLAHDAGGRTTSVTLAAGKTVTYTYDKRDNVTSVTDWLGGTVSFTYDDAGRPVSIERSNGVDTTIGYDGDNFVVGIDESAGTTALSSIALERDGRGNTTRADRTLPLEPTTPPADATLSYDAANQLTSATHDARGRVLTLAGRTYTYNTASQLDSYTEGGQTVAFAHDAFGRLIRRTEGGTVDEFVVNYGLDEPAASIQRRDGTDLRYFVHTPAGELLYSIDAATGAREFHHFDEVGNTLFLTDDAGAVTSSFAYSPYGEIVDSTGTSETPFTWGGRFGVMREPGTALYHMGRRVYDAETMRFLTREPRPELGHPQLIDPYVYAVGNPLRYVDPTGESPDDSGGAQPHKDTIKAGLKANKYATAVVAKTFEEGLARHGDVIAAADDINNVNRVFDKGKNPEWVESATGYSKRAKKLKKVADKLGKAGKYADLAIKLQENPEQTLFEEGVQEGAERLGQKLIKRKGLGKLAGVFIEGAKTNEEVEKVRADMDLQLSSDIANYYRISDAILEARRLKLITHEEAERRLIEAKNTFEQMSGGSYDAGIYGIWEQLARGTNKMLEKMIGL